MKRHIAWWAVWVLVQSQNVIASLDPEVLQWPGGALVAPLLWLFLTARFALVRRSIQLARLPFSGIAPCLRAAVATPPKRVASTLEEQ